MIGRFFNYFNEDHLSVFAPITSGFKIKGYVVIHYPKSGLDAERESLLTIDYLLLVILFMLSLIILIFRFARSPKRQSSTLRETCTMNFRWILMMR